MTGNDLRAAVTRPPEPFAVVLQVTPLYFQLLQLTHYRGDRTEETSSAR